MKKKVAFVAFVAVALVVSIAHARRGRPVVQKTVTPLSGYAGQIH